MLNTKKLCRKNLISQRVKILGSGNCVINMKTAFLTIVQYEHKPVLLKPFVHKEEFPIRQ